MSFFIDEENNEIPEFSKSNRLYNYKAGKFNELCIISPHADDLLCALCNGGKYDISVKTALKNEKLAYSGQIKNIEASSNTFSFINMNGSVTEAFDYLFRNSARIQKIYDNPALFIFYGFFEQNISVKKTVKTPLFIYPVNFIQNDEDGFTLFGKADSVFINPVARLKFFEENSISLPSSFPISSPADLMNAINRVKGILKSAALSDTVLLNLNPLNLTLFPLFSSYMYADYLIDYKKDGALKNCDNPVFDNFTHIDKDEKNKEDEYIPSDLNEVVFAPPDVLKTMAALKRGESFALESHLGCDKVSAIINLISQALSLRRRVLYVSRYDKTITDIKERLDREHINLTGVALLPEGKFYEMFVFLACRFLKNIYLPNNNKFQSTANAISITQQNIQKIFEEYKQLVSFLQKKDNNLDLPFEYIFEECLKLSDIPLLSPDFLNVNFIDKSEIRYIYDLLNRYDKIRTGVENDITLVNNPWLKERAKTRFTKEDIQNIILCLNGINDEIKYCLKRSDELKQYGLEIVSKSDVSEALKTVDFLLENSKNRDVIYDTRFFNNNIMLNKVLDAFYSKEDSEEHFCNKLVKIRTHLSSLSDVNSEKRTDFLKKYIPDINKIEKTDFLSGKAYIKELYKGIVSIGESSIVSLGEIEDELKKRGLLRFAVKVHNELLIKSSADVFKKSVLNMIIAHIPSLESVKNVTSLKFDNLFNALDANLRVFHKENTENINAVYKKTEMSVSSLISADDKNMLISCIKHKREAVSLEDSNINRLMNVFISSLPFVIMNIKDTVRFIPKASTFDVLIIDDAETLSMPDVLSLLERCKQVVIIGQKEHRFDLYRTHQIADGNDFSSLPVNSLFDVACKKFTVYQYRYVTSVENGNIEKLRSDMNTDKPLISYVLNRNSKDKYSIVRFESVVNAVFNPRTGINSVEAERVADIIKSIVIKKPESSISVLCAYPSQVNEIIAKLKITSQSSVRFKAFLNSVYASERLFISDYRETPPFKSDYVIFSSSITSFAPDSEFPFYDSTLFPTLISLSSKGLIMVSSFSKSEFEKQYEDEGIKNFIKLVENIFFNTSSSVRVKTVCPPLDAFLSSRGYKALYGFNNDNKNIDLTVTSSDGLQTLCTLDFDFKYHPSPSEIYKNEYVKRYIIEQSGLCYNRQFSSQWLTDRLNASASVSNVILRGNKNNADNNLSVKYSVPSNVMQYNYYYSLTPQKSGISPKDECTEVIINESPINEQWLFNRYSLKWYSSSSSKDAIKSFNVMIGQILKQNPTITRSKGFIYNQSSEIKFRYPESKEDERLVEYISNEELEALIGDCFVQRIIKNLSITSKTLFSDVIRVFPNADKKDIKRIIKLINSFVRTHKKYIP